MKTIHGACPHDCPDTCAWQVTVNEEGVATELRGNSDHPFTRGNLCTKLKRYTDRVYHKDRILYPLVRNGRKGDGEFKRISWEKAIEIIIGKLQNGVKRHGPLTAMPSNFAGTIGMLQRYAGDQFFAKLGATGVERDICGNVSYEAVGYSVGTGDIVLPEDLEHSRYIVIWGNNSAVTNVHLWGGAIRRARKKGAKIVVVDPIKTPTAAHADWHIQIKPGTDAALALGMMHVIVKENLHDKDYVKKYTLGFEKLCERIKEYNPYIVSEITGLMVEDIRTLAREYATTKPAVLRLMVGMERYSNGAMNVRAVTCLPALVGAYKELGGGICQFTVNLMFEALDHGVVFAPEELPQPKRTTHLNQLGKALTNTDLSPPITWLMVYNLNPVVTLPNQNLIIEGLKRENLFTLVHEQFMTETAKYADIVLPATTQFEHWELMPSWGHTYVSLNPPAIKPLGEAVSNTELFRMLSKAMGFKEPYLLSSDEERIRQILNTQSELASDISFDNLMETGWAKLNLPEDWRPRAKGNFTTPSGKCEFYSETLEKAGYDPLPTYTPVVQNKSDKDYPLHLVSAKTSHFLNSEYVNLPHKGTRNHFPQMQINEIDAAARGIREGDNVRIFNALGEVEVKAKVSSDTATGVVYMPFNWWMSSTLNGSSVNALTPDGLSELNKGSNAFDAKVEIVKL